MVLRVPFFRQTYTNEKKRILHDTKLLVFDICLQGIPLFNQISFWCVFDAIHCSGCRADSFSFFRKPNVKEELSARTSNGSACRSIPAKPAVNLYQQKRHPIAQSKLRLSYSHSDFKPKTFIHMYIYTDTYFIRNSSPN